MRSRSQRAGMIADVEHQRFTVDQYHRMAEAGILTEDCLLYTSPSPRDH
jgi:hypothetical protein